MVFYLMIWNGDYAHHEAREQLATFMATTQLPASYSHAKRTRNALDTYCSSDVGMKISRGTVYHTHTYKHLQRRLTERFCFHFSKSNGCAPATLLNKTFKHIHTYTYTIHGSLPSPTHAEDLRDLHN